MDSVRQLLFKLKGLLRRRAMESEMAEEMNAHLERLIATYRADGMAAEEARRAALRQFGNRASIDERARDERRWRWLEHVVRDLRYALRQIRRAPTVSATAVLSLALGLGSSVAIFSAVHGILLKELPFPDADRLAVVQKGPAGAVSDAGIAPANAREIAERVAPLADVSPFTFTEVIVPYGDRAERVTAMRVGPNFFRLFGVAPMLGRDFLPSDDAGGAPRVAIISSALWRRLFASDPATIGRTVGTGPGAATIVGVMPDGFRMPEIFGRLSNADAWTPLAYRPAEVNMRGAGYMYLLVKRAAHVSPALLETELAAIARAYAATEPRVYAGQELRAIPARELVVRRARSTLLLLWAAVTCLLLIACANAANVVLSRTAARSRELAVRASLGASKRRLFAQLVTESVVLASVAATIGVAVAASLLAVGRYALIGFLPRAQEISLDWTVLQFTVAATALTALIVGVLPTYRSLSIAPRDAMGEAGTRSSTESLWASNLRRVLLVAQIAIAVVLGTTAGLLGRSLAAVLRTDLGFEPKALLTFELSLPTDGRPQASVTAYYEQLIARLRSHALVSSVGALSMLPLSDSDFGWTFHVADKPVTSGALPHADVRIVSPGALEVLEVPIRRGRTFQWADRADGQPVAIVNEAFARRTWPREEAIGKQIRLAGSIENFPWMTVIGVVADVRFASPDQLADPAIYRPLGQHRWRDMTLLVRTPAPAAPAIAAVRDEIAHLGDGVVLLGAREFTFYLSRSVAERRIVSAVVGTFAGCALILALIGVYGVFAYAVASRTREIGVRIALGAGTRRIIFMMMRQALAVCGMGVVTGVAGIFAARRLIATQLFDVQPMDPATLVVTAMIIVTTALVACYLPARRASTIDPTSALRAD
jgi:putative ABC transport system permease protein